MQKITGFQRGTIVTAPFEYRLGWLRKPGVQTVQVLKNPLYYGDDNETYVAVSGKRPTFFNSTYYTSMHEVNFLRFASRQGATVQTYNAENRESFKFTPMDQQVANLLQMESIWEPLDDRTSAIVLKPNFGLYISLDENGYITHLQEVSDIEFADGFNARKLRKKMQPKQNIAFVANKDGYLSVYGSPRARKMLKKSFRAAQDITDSCVQSLMDRYYNYGLSNLIQLERR